MNRSSTWLPNRRNATGSSIRGGDRDGSEKKVEDLIKKLPGVEVDANGRVQISKDLVKFADINKEVVLNSSVNMIEIWDKDKYEESINVDDIDFASLAEDVMGNLGVDE